MIFNLLKNIRIYKNRKSDKQPDNFTAIRGMPGRDPEIGFPPMAEAWSSMRKAG